MQEQTLFNVDIKKPKKEHYSTSTKSPWFWSWKISMNGQGHYWKFGKDDTNWTLKAGRSEFRSEERSYRPYMIRNGPYHRQSLILQSWNFSLLSQTFVHPLYRVVLIQCIHYSPMDGLRVTTLRFTNGPMLAQKLTSNWSSRKVCAVRCVVSRNHCVASHNPTNDQVTRGSLRTSTLDQIHYT